MDYRAKPSFIRGVAAYLSAAIVFILVCETVVQAIVFAKTGAFMPMDERHIACLKLTFAFLLLAGFLIVSLGHLIITLSRMTFGNVKKRHSFAYAIGYIVFVIFGAARLIYLNPELGRSVVTAWWAFVISAGILFMSALVAGRAFAQIYDQSHKLSTR